MNKVLAVLICFALILTSSLVLITYSNDVEEYEEPYIEENTSNVPDVEDVVTYTVAFDSNGGTSVSSQSVAAGSTATEPDAPTSTIYAFVAWCSDSSLSTVFDFDTAITCDMTLYAVWGDGTVTYQLNGGINSEFNVTSYNGILGLKLYTPSREQYAFTGWYTDMECTQLVEDTVSGNITLYAGWTEEIGTEGLVYEYSDSSQDSYMVTCYTGAELDVTVPSYYNGLPVVTIAESAFNSSQDATCIQSIHLPSTIKTIEYSAFVYSDIVSITIPEGVETIDFGVFYGCSKLESVIIPSTVSYIGTSICGQATSLTEIKVVSANQYYCSIDDNLYSKDESTLLQYSIGKTDAQFVVPDTVTFISTGAFGYSSLTSIVLLSSTMTIDTMAFNCCYKLVEVYNLTDLQLTADSHDNGSVAKYAKDIYTSLDAVSKLSVVDGFVVYTDDDVVTLISYIGTDTHIVIDSSITIINDYAFAYNYDIETIVVPETIVYLGDSVFLFSEIDVFFECSVASEDWSSIWSNCFATSNYGGTVSFGDSWCYVDGVPTANVD